MPQRNAALGGAYYYAGRYDEAVQRLNEADHAQPPGGRAEHAFWLALCHARLGHPAEARQWLAKKGFDPVYGARPLSRVIQTEVRDRLTDEILFGVLEHGGTVTIGVANDALTFEFEIKRESGAQEKNLTTEKTEITEDS